MTSSHAGAANTVAQRLHRHIEVEEVTVDGGKHAMLSHASEFERAAVEFTAAALH
ncbi:hypothetical protein [Nocardioides mangrovicus]|nr:hypothetical protein [Nocardioides mangrovicus]